MRDNSAVTDRRSTRSYEKDIVAVRAWYCSVDCVYCVRARRRVHACTPESLQTAVTRRRAFIGLDDCCGECDVNILSISACTRRDRPRRRKRKRATAKSWWGRGNDRFERRRFVWDVLYDAKGAKEERATLVADCGDGNLEMRSKTRI